MRKFRPNVEALDERINPIANYVWDGGGTTDNWSELANWRVNGVNPAQLPGVTDLVTFDANVSTDSCVLNVNASVGNVVWSATFPASNLLQIGAYTLTTDRLEFRNSAVIEFTNEAGKLVIDAASTSYWEDSADFRGSQGTVELTNGADLVVTDVGTKNLHCRLDVGADSVLVFQTSCTGVIDLHTSGHIAIAAGGEMFVYNTTGVNLIFDTDLYNPFPIDNAGSIVVATGATSRVYVETVINNCAATSSMDLETGGLTVKGVTQSAGETRLYVGFNLELYELPFTQTNGAFFISGYHNGISWVGGFATATGDFEFTGGEVRFTQPWSDVPAVGLDVEGTVLLDDMVLKMRVDDESVYNDVLEADAIVINGGTLRIEEKSVIDANDQLFPFRCESTTNNIIGNGFDNMYLGLTGTTTLTDSYDVEEWTGSLHHYLRLTKK